jgi:hypothetical protein
MINGNGRGDSFFSRMSVVFLAALIILAEINACPAASAKTFGGSRQQKIMLMSSISYDAEKKETYNVTDSITIIKEIKEGRTYKPRKSMRRNGHKYILSDVSVNEKVFVPEHMQNAVKFKDYKTLRGAERAKDTMSASVRDPYTGKRVKVTVHKTHVGKVYFDADGKRFAEGKEIYRVYYDGNKKIDEVRGSEYRLTYEYTEDK